MVSWKDEDDDVPELSADTLAVLGDFYSEKERNEKQFEDMKAQMEQERFEAPLSMSMFSEDWNASQFWAIFKEDTIVSCATRPSLARIVKPKALRPQWIVCTGERMEELIHKLYPGTKTTKFQPRHIGDRLSNDFRCYANIDSESWETG
ncbi:MAG: hypothetical protein Q9196_000729 [Gyalolechia fulgens]